MSTKSGLFRIRKEVYSLILSLFLIGGLSAQDSTITVRGTVQSDSSVMAGVTVFLKSDSTIMTYTDEAGMYTIKAPSNGVLIFSHIGFLLMEKPIQGASIINVKMNADGGKNLDEVITVAYGTQKKTSLVSSVIAVDPAQIKGPTSNLTTMLAGRIPGMISFQTTGEPGKDNASFFVRGLGTFGSGKIDPLILIDNIESTTTDLARLQPDNIAGFSVLKDATATAVYGARGANGVVLVTTKSGQIGKLKFGIRIENSSSSNTKDIALANNVSYMSLANEAVLLIV